MSTHATNLLAVIEEFRKLDPTIPLQTVHCFVLAAEAQDRGTYMPVPEIGKITQLSNSARSRNINMLTSRSWNGQPGLDLIITSPDAFDPRTHVVMLTPKGSRLWATIKQLMEG